MWPGSHHTTWSTPSAGPTTRYTRHSRGYRAAEQGQRPEHRQREQAVPRDARVAAGRQRQQDRQQREHRPLHRHPPRDADDRRQVADRQVRRQRRDEVLLQRDAVAPAPSRPPSPASAGTRTSAAPPGTRARCRCGPAGRRRRRRGRSRARRPRTAARPAGRRRAARRRPAAGRTARRSTATGRPRCRGAPPPSSAAAARAPRRRSRRPARTAPSRASTARTTAGSRRARRRCGSPTWSPNRWLRDGHHGEQAGQAGEIRQHQAATDGRDADLVQTAQDQRHQREEAVLLGQRRRVQHLRHVEVAQPVPGHERVPEVLRRIAHRRVACRHPPRRPLGGGEVEDPRQGPRDDDRPDHLRPGPRAATCGRGRRRPATSATATR